MSDNYDSTEKQKLLIEYMLSSTDTFGVCQNIIDASFFNPELKNSVNYIKKYYEKYNTTPSIDILKAETDTLFDKKEITPDLISYTCNEIEAFCKRKALENAILSSPALIENGDYNKVETMIKDAILISLNTKLGLRYFETMDERYERLLNENPTHRTGWDKIDELLYGGISRKELLLFSANSGGGKSVSLANLVYNMLKDNLNCLYISLELSEDVVGQRFDTMYSGISRKNWRPHVNEIKTKVLQHNNGGILDIIQMKSETTANDIKAFLKKYYLHYNFMPDLLILDYLDKMNPNEKMDLGNVSLKDKKCSEQLRDIGVEYNMMVATASQLNRDAVNATQHNHSHIAGGMTKINESDVYISIRQPVGWEYSGEMVYSFQKTRNSDGVGSEVFMHFDRKNLRITEAENQNKNDININVIKKKTHYEVDDSNKPPINSHSDDQLLKMMSGYKI